jgi:hypothetical protein
MADKFSDILRTVGYVPMLRIRDVEEAWLQTLRTAMPITTGSLLWFLIIAPSHVYKLLNNCPKTSKNYNI